MDPVCQMYSPWTTIQFVFDGICLIIHLISLTDIWPLFCDHSKTRNRVSCLIKACLNLLGLVSFLLANWCVHVKTLLAVDFGDEWDSHESFHLLVFIYCLFNKSAFPCRPRLAITARTTTTRSNRKSCVRCSTTTRSGHIKRKISCLCSWNSMGSAIGTRFRRISTRQRTVRSAWNTTTVITYTAILGNVRRIAF